MFESSQSDTSSRGWPIFFAVALGFSYLVAVGFLLNGRVQTAAWGLFPLAQLVYVGPLAYYTGKRGNLRSMQGWLIGGAVAALLYAPCWGLALGSGLS